MIRAHFNHAGMSTTPTLAFARVLEHLELEQQIGGYEAAEAVESELAAVAESVARLLGARASEVTITESATAAWEWSLWAMAETFGWGANDRILLDRFAYATMDAGLRRLALAHGVDIVEVGSLPDGTIDLEALDDLVDDRVRLVLVTHMPTHVGTLTDAAEVGQVLSGSGAIYALDISQTVGQMAVDVQALGCDVAFAAGPEVPPSSAWHGAPVRASIARRPARSTHALVRYRGRRGDRSLRPRVRPASLRPVREWLRGPSRSGRRGSLTQCRSGST